MVRTTLSTLVMAAGIVAAGTAPAYAEEICAEAGVKQQSDPRAGTGRVCHPSPFTTNPYEGCFGSTDVAVCAEVVTP